MPSPAEAVSAAVEPLALEHAAPRRRVTRGRSERALIRGAQAGSEADLEELFRRHWRRAYRTAYLIVHDHAGAEDIAQEAFVAAIRTLHRFDRRRAFAPWLGRIVANRAIDWTRSRSARREVGHEPRDEFSGVGSAGELSAVGGAAGFSGVGGAAEFSGVGGAASYYSDEVVAALKSLSPEHRAVVVLRYVLEYTPGEIARALDLPRGTVNSRLRRGLDALDARLREAPQ